MRLLRLKLVGFLGIMAAKGADHVELDLNGETAQLIALVGENGSGKSTLLDNFHPYLTMPSKASSGGAFSFYDHIAETASKEFDFEVGGVVFRQVVRWKNGKTRTAEATLFKRSSNGEWDVSRSPSGLASDGKIDTYNKLIEELVGPASLYFTAIHQGQDRMPLYRATNGEAKSLLISLMGLGDVPLIGQRAEAIRKSLAAEIDRVSDVLGKAMATQREAREQCSRLIGEANAQIAKANQASEQSTQSLLTLRQQRDQWVAAVADSAAAIARIDKIDAEIRVIETDRVTQQRTLRESFSQLESALNDTIKAKVEERASLQRQIESANTALAKAGDIEKLEQSIRTAEQSRPAIAESIDTLMAALNAAETAVTDEQALVQQHTLLTQKISNAKQRGTDRKSHVETVKAQTVLMGEVPCQTTASFHNSCKLLAEARAAMERLPALESELTTLREQYQSIRDEQVALRLPDLAAKTVLVNAAKSSLLDAQRRLAECDRELARRGELLLATESLAKARLELPQSEARFVGLNRDIDAAQQSLAAARQTNIASLTTLEADAASKLRALREEKAGIATGDALAALKRCEADIAVVEKELERSRADVITQQSRIAAFEADQARAVQALDEAEAKLKRLDAVVQAQADFALLAKAFSANGIVALIIDEAAPALTQIANDLLLACYGARFMVQINTQIANQNGSMKEGLEIVVRDDRDGSVKRVAKMSGGERIWIEQSIVRAISIHLARSSGRSFETLVADETDGALDEEKKRQFFLMKRKTLQIGGYRQEIFVSHSSEIQSMADRVIDISTL